MLHSQNIPEWEVIKKYVLTRDNFACTICHARLGDVSFPGATIVSRYASQEGDLFTVIKPFVYKEAQVRFVEPLSVSLYYDERITWKKANDFPYHYAKIAQERNADGKMISEIVATYEKENSYILQGGKSWTLDKIPVRLDVHHKNHSEDDNRLENLITLCRICHQKTHGCFFPDVDNDITFQYKMSRMSKREISIQLEKLKKRLEQIKKI